GAFTANMHTDFNPSNSQTWSTAIINAAKARNVPVITAKQLLDWLVGRNASAFQSLSWGGNVLSFNVSVGANANGLYAMLPNVAPSGGLTGLLYNGSPLTYTTQTIKGVSYAVFPAGAGAYQASYGDDQHRHRHLDDERTFDVDGELRHQRRVAELELRQLGDGDRAQHHRPEPA